MIRKLWVKFNLWRLDRAKAGPKMHPMNRRLRRAAARRLASAPNRKQVYRALKERER